LHAPDVVGSCFHGDRVFECRYSKGDVAELRAEVEALKAGMGGGMGGSKAPMGNVGNGKPAAGHTEAMVV
jgi:hypothetical protein